MTRFKKAVLMTLIANILAAGLIFAAQEITQNFTLKVMKGNLNFQKAVNVTPTLTAANPNVAGGTILVSTAPTGTLVSVGYVVTNGVAWFGNLSTNNFVELGVQVSGTFYPLVRLNAGESYPMRIAQGVTPFLRADTASVVTEFYIFDN